MSSGCKRNLASDTPIAGRLTIRQRPLRGSVAAAPERSPSVKTGFSSVPVTPMAPEIACAPLAPGSMTMSRPIGRYSEQVQLTRFQTTQRDVAGLADVGRLVNRDLAERAPSEHDSSALTHDVRSMRQQDVMKCVDLATLAGDTERGREHRQSAPIVQRRIVPCRGGPAANRRSAACRFPVCPHRNSSGKLHSR